MGTTSEKQRLRQDNMLKHPTIYIAGVAVLAVGIGVSLAVTREVPAEPSPTVDVAVVESASGTRPVVEVWKSASCGCCKDWVSYLEKAGFPVTTHDTDDMNSVKARLGLPGAHLASCHTATVDGYLVEGHVPVTDIERLLAERPDIVGISAPGMPMMSPGMGSDVPRDYDVLSFDAAGEQSVFSRY